MCDQKGYNLLGPAKVGLSLDESCDKEHNSEDPICILVFCFVGARNGVTAFKKIGTQLSTAKFIDLYIQNITSCALSTVKAHPNEHTVP